VAPVLPEPRGAETAHEAEPSVDPSVELATVPGAAPRSSGPVVSPNRFDRTGSETNVLLDDTLQPEPLTPPEPLGLVARLRQALGRSREALQGRFDALFGKPIDDALFEELEETLLLADVGVQTAGRITEKLRQMARSGDADADALRDALRAEMAAILRAVDPAFAGPRSESPLVILVVGVNGSGKTTTIGKLAARFAADGHDVLLAAADTYRAAAVDQLKVWAERTGSDFVSHDEGADPGAVVFDALEAAKARNRDVVIIDTAGRLQTRKPLMEQLSKLQRVIRKHVPDGPHETLLVLDGTMGQNGLSQARLFDEATPLSGVVVTKLDGTAKGGMVLTIAAELGLPVKFIGIGEGVEDLRPFEADAFVEALA
jgi:fused signal recognition particle receptor